MKVYVSQPFDGKDDDSIIGSFNRAIDKVKSSFPDEEDIEFTGAIDAYLETGKVPNVTRRINMMKNCDYVVFLHGWAQSKDCRIDMSISKALDVQGIYINEDILDSPVGL